MNTTNDDVIRFREKMVAFFSDGEPSDGLKLGNIQETLETMDLADSNDTHAHDEDEHMNEANGVTETTGEGQNAHEGEEEEHDHAHVDVIAEKVQRSRFFGDFQYISKILSSCFATKTYGYHLGETALGRVIAYVFMKKYGQLSLNCSCYP